MSSKSLTEEEKRKYEKEFSELLLQRITHAGGSLQFHHLSGLIQQARFEIRDAFGTTKSELMKFLKSHPKIFQIDSAGFVTVTNSSVSDGDSDDFGTSKKATCKEIVPRKIEKGVGRIVKLHPEFGIIKATKPIVTKVHFKPEAFFGNKDTLLSDSILEIEDDVYFNAVLGHDEYDIKFRATKVWQEINGREVSADNSIKQDISNDLNGEGVVQNLQADFGFISVYGKEKERVFFHISSVRECSHNELTKFLSIGETVEFFATRTNKKDSKCQWQATVVKKKLKNIQSPTHVDDVKSKLVNEAGKIYPLSYGAVIKFGKGFTQQADGGSSKFFFYGAEVSDLKCIKWEFSDGDDVLFDALKSQSAPGWKAVLVWVGEKPACNYEVFLGKEREFSDDESCASLSNIRPTVAKSHRASMLKDTEHNERKSLHPSVNRKFAGSDKKFQKNNLNLSRPQNFSTGKSRNRNRRNAPQKDNSSFNRNEKDREREVTYEPKREKTPNKNIALHEVSDDFEHHFSFKDDTSDSSEDSFQDKEFSTVSHDGKYLLEEGCDKSFLVKSRHNFSDTESQNDVDNACNAMKLNINPDKKKASIKIFKDIDGKIVDLYCKAAIIESSHLQQNVDFIINDFYLNGKSVEERQVIDLKEIIKVGEIIKFNCFEIVDDFGEIKQKVTVAWKGQKPEVYEMTPENFIFEHELSVTISNESVSECLFEETTEQDYCSGETSESNSSDSSSSIRSDEENFKESRTMDHPSGEKTREEDISTDVNNTLSEVIIQRLKNKGLISLDEQVEFCSVLPEITSLVQKHCDRCNSAALNETLKEKSKIISKSVCSTCAERTFPGKNTAAQTIITGGIIAQSIYTQY